jgi:pimeloyl-ACP methyl ester carboxylesterase
MVAARGYTREDYLGDLDAFFGHLAIDHAVLLGNSLGAVNAFQFAARQPARVRALIIVDIFAEIAGDPAMASAWGGTFPTRQALLERVGPRFAPFLRADWLATSCPALRIRGSESRVTTAAQMAEMAARRPGAQLVTLEAGHVAYMDDVVGFTRTVRAFLDGLSAHR